MFAFIGGLLQNCCVVVILVLMELCGRSTGGSMHAQRGIVWGMRQLFSSWLHVQIRLTLEVSPCSKHIFLTLFLCFSSMGGIPARNNKGERLLLYIGIIDILQSYR